MPTLSANEHPPTPPDAASDNEKNGHYESEYEEHGHKGSEYEEHGRNGSEYGENGHSEIEHEDGVFKDAVSRPLELVVIPSKDLGAKARGWTSLVRNGFLLRCPYCDINAHFDKSTKHDFKIFSGSAGFTRHIRASHPEEAQRLSGLKSGGYNAELLKHGKALTQEQKGSFNRGGEGVSVDARVRLDFKYKTWYNDRKRLSANLALRQHEAPTRKRPLEDEDDDDEQNVSNHHLAEMAYRNYVADALRIQAGPSNYQEKSSFRRTIASPEDSVLGRSTVDVVREPRKRRPTGKLLNL